MIVFCLYLAGWTGEGCRLSEMSRPALRCCWLVGLERVCWDSELEGDRTFLWHLMGTSIRFARYTVLHSSTESDRKLEDKHRECEHTDHFPILEILQNLVLRGI